MKLQLALDEMKTEEAIKLVEKVKDYIDIIEVGTPICLALWVVLAVAGLGIIALVVLLVTKRKNKKD